MGDAVGLRLIRPAFRMSGPSLRGVLWLLHGSSVPCGWHGCLAAATWCLPGRVQHGGDAEAYGNGATQQLGGCPSSHRASESQRATSFG